MKKNIEQRADLAALTKKEKIALDFLIKNQGTACLMTSNEIGRELGIGASSVVRLSAKLGFENFTAMRKALHNQVLGSGQPAPEQIPYEKLADTEHLSEPELLEAYTRNVENHIRVDSNRETEAKLQSVAGAILKAQRVFVVGFRACAGFAGAFVTMLTCCRANVFSVGRDQPLVDQLMGLTSKDLLIAFSFHRYSKDTFFAAQMARDMNASVAVMTDSFTAPLAEYADIVVINSVDNFSFFNAYTSLVMNMEKIVLLVGHKSIKDTRKRLADMERYLDKTNQY
ncbi:MurR/RpiR family transcriptional regulator [Deltaproteobacteria bacterium Smac51]|nr:MurR/RpiR family transcriptional regulator [Deltaproteobacteria bacterium Smac51]